jgi:hypothetical protein
VASLSLQCLKKINVKKLNSGTGKINADSQQSENNILNN